MSGIFSMLIRFRQGRINSAAESSNGFGVIDPDGIFGTNFAGAAIRMCFALPSIWALQSKSGRGAV